MSRQTRLDLAAYPQHVTQRGNDRRRIFGSDDDRRYYLHLVLSAAQRVGVAVHAYVLMDNHVHLLLTPGSDGATGRFMQSVGVRYVGWFNRRYGRTGTLWEGRYRASVIDADEYLLACQRYIELNPVRAGMVAGPAQFAWSSHAVNAGGNPETVLQPHAVYRALGPSAERRRNAYRQLFDTPFGTAQAAHIRRHTAYGWALGGAAFVARVSALGGRRATPLPHGGGPRTRLR